MSRTLNVAGGLRAVLQARGISVSELCRRAGVNQKNYYTQMSRNNVLLSTVERYADALDMPLSELVAEIENKSLPRTSCKVE